MTPTYMSWTAMKARCKRKSHYLIKGITVCPEWESFSTFLADMGERPEGTTLERIKNNLGYFPANCKWATRIEQQQNRDTTRFLEICGVIKPITVWSRELGISCAALRWRKKAGWSDARMTSSLRGSV